MKVSTNESYFKNNIYSAITNIFFPKAFFRLIFFLLTINMFFYYYVSNWPKIPPSVLNKWAE